MSPKPHLVVIGGGSAGFAGAFRAHALGARVTVANTGLPRGGTCPNVGCVPSKFYIRAAEQFHRAHHPTYRGWRPAGTPTLDWPALVAEKRELIAQITRPHYVDHAESLDDFEVVDAPARLLGPRALDIGGATCHADAILIATGTRPRAPIIPEIGPGVEWLSNDTLFDLPELPASLIVLGGGYIALECAQMMARFGTEVTVLQRSAQVLSHQPAYVAKEIERWLREEGIRIETGTSLRSASRNGKGVEVTYEQDGEMRRVRAEHLVAVQGRQPNTEDLGLETAGVETDRSGSIRTDARFETTAPGIYAAGDVIGAPELVYTASEEAERAVENALTGSSLGYDPDLVPWVVFTDPQVAGIGPDEDQARARGLDVDTAELPVTRWPRFRVAGETRGFLRLIRDRQRNVLVGARAVCPEGGDLMSEIRLAILNQTPVPEIAHGFHPYLTLSEGIERAALKFAD